MKCIRCGSHRMIRFLDGFGNPRIFCRDCWNSTPLIFENLPKNQARLSEFGSHLKVNIPISR